MVHRCLTQVSGHPITDRPAIAPHPMGRSLGQLVLFGTGQFIEYADNMTVGEPTQTMYAIWDLAEDLADDGTHRPRLQPV